MSLYSRGEGLASLDTPPAPNLPSLHFDAAYAEPAPPKVFNLAQAYAQTLGHKPAPAPAPPAAVNDLSAGTLPCPALLNFVYLARRHHWTGAQIIREVEAALFAVGRATDGLTLGLILNQAVITKAKA